MTSREREILAKLDSIEERNLPPSVDSEARELMEEFASSPGKLRYLIDRYGCSPSSHIACRVTVCLCRKQPRAGFEESQTLCVALAQKLRRDSDHSGTVVTMLSALTRALNWTDSVAADLAPLREFLWACLKDRSHQADDVHGGAVEVLRELLKKDAYDMVVRPDEDSLVIQELEFIVKEFESIEKRCRSDYLAPLADALSREINRRVGHEVSVPERSERTREVIEMIRARRRKV